MARMRFAKHDVSAGGMSKASARIFDLLLVVGYIACIVFTYLLVTRDAGTVVAPPPVESAEVSPEAKGKDMAPPTEMRPTPTPPPVSADLIEAMELYVAYINEKKYTAAINMRADDNIPTIDRMKKTQGISLISATPYPRVHRERGSIYVVLEIQRQGGDASWSGRVDWEQRGTRWVTTKWDSSADPPMVANETSYPVGNPDMAPAQEEPTPEPTPEPTQTFEFNTQ